MGNYRKESRGGSGSPSGGDAAVEALTRATEAMKAAEAAMIMARDSLARKSASSSTTVTAVSTRAASITAETPVDAQPLTNSPSPPYSDHSPNRKSRRSGRSRSNTHNEETKYIPPPPPAPPSPPSPPYKAADSRARKSSYVDLYDAVAAQKIMSIHERREADGLRNYGEDVAARNLTKETSRSESWNFTYPLAIPGPDDESDEPMDDVPTPHLSRSNTRATQYTIKDFSAIHEVAFVAVVCCAQLLTQAGLAQSVTPLHIIGASFGTTDPAQLSWYPAGYSLTVGTFILPAGRLGDIYGHKKIFIIGWLWFSIFSLLAGFSVYVEQAGLRGGVFFACCRAFQGIGPALILPNALAILGRTYEAGNKKNMTFALFGATAPSGFVVGACFSGLFAQTIGWQWAYWLMGIVTFIMAILTILVVPSPHAREFRRTVSKGGVGWKARFNQLDGLGMILGVAGLVLINFAWNQGPVVGWTTPYTYFILIIGLLLIVAFCYVESRAATPLVPLDAITRDTLFVLACMGLGWSCFGIWVFYTWQILEVERHISPLLATAQFTPCAISGFAAAIATGLLLHKVGPQRTMLVSMCAFTIGVCLVSFMPINQIYWAQTFVSIVVMPWGMDMSFPSATIIMSNSVKREHQGIAASLVNTVVNYSISIGLGIAGTVEVHENGGGLNVLKGYRSAYYVGIGLAGMGVCVAALFVLCTILDEKKARANDEKGTGSDTEVSPGA